MIENRAIFERNTPGERVVVLFLVDGLNNIAHPKLDEVLHAIHVPYLVFEGLVKRDFSPIEDSYEQVKNDQGQKIEDVLKKVARTAIGEIDVLDVLLHEEVVSRPGGDMSLHLKSGTHGGFEAIYVVEGRAKMAFPKKVTGSGLVYVQSQERDEIELVKNTLVVIQAPVANAWSEVDPGFQFRYISQPKWDRSFVRAVE